MIAERWKPIVGYDGIYEVSSLGRVKSCERLCHRPGHTGNFVLGESFLKLHPNPKGYLTVALTKNKKRRTITVHRVVAMAFIPNPKKKPCLNHLNGIKTDNRVSNLKWCTHKENINHAWATGLVTHSLYSRFGVSCRKLKLRAESIREMVELLQTKGYPATLQGLRNAKYTGGMYLGMKFVYKEK